MNSLGVKITRILVTAVFVFGIMAVGAFAGQAGEISHTANGITVYTPRAQSNAMPDFANAKPMPLPQAQFLPLESLESCQGGPPPQSSGTPGFSPGFPGSGQKLVTNGSNAIGPEQANAMPLSEDEGIVPEEQGTSAWPFNTSTVDIPFNEVSKFFPYRASGKLYFQEGSNWYVCSATMIKRGLAVTAAHCVANYGKSQFYNNWWFYPAKYGSSNPYGSYQAAQATVVTKYFNGTDSCYQKGVVCPDDVAILYFTSPIGTSTGWMGYGYDGWGFNGGSPNRTLLNQL